MRQKLIRFEENKARANIIEPGKALFDEVKGHWDDLVFKNDHPIVLELGCGRGEYTVALAQEDSTQNFIGIDVQGERIWYGSGEAEEKGLENVAFLRIQIENLEQFFAKDEVSELWITFPDPHPKKRNIKKRLTAPRFLDIYHRLLKTGGVIHLKTDSQIMFDYTKEVLNERTDIEVQEEVFDLYAAPGHEKVKSVQTNFEKKFLQKGKTIKYIRFCYKP